MKSHLDKNAHQLTDHEREDLWRRIADAAPPRRRRRPLLLPATGAVGTLAVAALVLLVVRNDPPTPLKHYTANPTVPAVREIVTAPATSRIETVPASAVGDARTNERKTADAASVLPASRDKDTSGPVAAATGPAAPSGAVDVLQIDDRTLPPDEMVMTREFREFVGEAETDNFGSGNAATTQSFSGGTLHDYAIDSVEQARGGRSGEAKLRIERPAEAAARSGSVTGGTTPPNGEAYELMYFEHAGVNPFIAVEDDRLSTFAVDVDEASWTVTRNYLSRNQLPPAAAVRVEEFVNAFDAGFAPQRDDVFAIHADGSPAPFRDGYHLLRLTVQGRDVSPQRRRPSQLVFVIDVSGSMDQENRLELVKRSLRILVDELGEGDRVGIVVYGSDARTVLEPVDASRRGTILDAVERLRPEGSTNAAAGLGQAYDMARRHYDDRANNRLVLCSDGVANMDETAADDILARVRRESDRGIYLSTVGFGMGNYNDVLMERLADTGDGNYAYVDRLEEAERVFRENLTATLQVIARDAKIQVEFDPATVDRYRLLGYENRDVADRDFRNDDVDAGEVGAGHTVTALYELKLVRDDDRPDPLARRRAPRLATVRVRYEEPAGRGRGVVREIEQRVGLEDLSRSFAAAPERFRLQAAVAEFAEILRHSFWAKDHRIADLVPLADDLARDLRGDERVRDFRDAVRRAAALEGDGEWDDDRPRDPRE
ncbi:MAG: von Willebrand factor type A domain-containing protein [Candidatus Latescibacteria bacterium]|nr:von Willebrand factor type A domain-containing protein [Candidatus Latescibacterota bacterium]